MSNMDSRRKVTAIRLRIFTSLFGGLFVFLVFSEFLNAIFNIQYDILGYSLAQRVPLAFKPTVMLFYALFSSILYYLVLRYLRPLLRFLASGGEAGNARGAAIRMPWVIILFQVGAWSSATVVYYGIGGWQVSSGIPLFFGLLTKLATGFVSALYVTFMINYQLKEAKRELHITDMRPGERDLFSRYKDYLANFSAVFFITSYAAYIGYYFASQDGALGLGGFLLSAGPAFIALIAVGIVPIFLSKREYRFQIDSILREMKELTEGSIDLSQRIDIINFDELGELSMYVNRNITRYSSFTSGISQMVEQLVTAALSLSTTSQENSSVSNEQAAAVAEVVSTMEDADRLGKAAAERAGEVDYKSLKTLETVTDGVNLMANYLQTMESIRKSNENTLEFIRSLNEDIKTIWDVVRMINSIANQVKIIAFNAELEASSAGPAGKNFEIVATEIRRLADNTVASTAEIRDKTKLIEGAARNLIESSENTTKAIQSGWDNSKRIQEAFDSVKTSSEDTSVSAQAINESMRMQTGGFEQILMTMKQIARSTSDVAQSTSMITGTAQNLTGMVAEMRKLTQSQEGNA
jgi:methyl-accepting chemotaxis protein